MLWGAPGYPFRRISILTRQLGSPLENSSDPLETDEAGLWLDEPGGCLHPMHGWRSSFNSERVCSVVVTSISSQCVSGHTMGPIESEMEFHEYLLSPASSHGFASTEEYAKMLT
jgi:hypothetical protein